MLGGSGDVRAQAMFLPSGCPNLVGRTHKPAMVTHCDKFHGEVCTAGWEAPGDSTHTSLEKEESREGCLEKVPNHLEVGGIQRLRVGSRRTF